MYAFKSFDLNISMVHSAIFSKTVCHGMIYENWHTAICMNCQSADSLENLAQNI